MPLLPRLLLCLFDYVSEKFNSVSPPDQVYFEGDSSADNYSFPNSKLVYISPALTGRVIDTSNVESFASKPYANRREISLPRI